MFLPAYADELWSDFPFNEHIFGSLGLHAMERWDQNKRPSVRPEGESTESA